MRPSSIRSIHILPQKLVPKPHLKCIHPPPPRRSEQKPVYTLIDHLKDLEKQREKDSIEAHRRKQMEGVEVNVQPWPKNLRVEPALGRKDFAKIPRKRREQWKDLLRER